MFEIHYLPPPLTFFCFCRLKVISFSAPLKPFIAIVVEVVVLVAAILLYEKSRSKKNPTEGSLDLRQRLPLFLCFLCAEFWREQMICLFVSENGISEQTNTL